ncbi:unnamed protein product [Pleuronectes platessa]|uniref:Uncharacterized protein n=1 Tax=Pleuronectes platessa TaxID=8262 RepID=A0A9N7VUM4_PLEPL|nr:unnamed protein product [Pleuronectes platessa]
MSQEKGSVDILETQCQKDCKANCLDDSGARGELSHWVPSPVPPPLGRKGRCTPSSPDAVKLQARCQLHCSTHLHILETEGRRSVKEILIRSALKVETKVERSSVFPATQVGIVRLKQMTPGFPTIDHNKKNTPTADCSHLPLQLFSLAVRLSTHLPKHSEPSFLLQHHGELTLSEGRGVGGGGGGWAHTEGDKWRDGEWEESPGCQGVTSLDTTSSSPSNDCAPPQ